MSTKNSSRFTPVIIAVSVVLGILIGTFYAKHFAGNRLGGNAIVEIFVSGRTAANAVNADNR